MHRTRPRGGDHAPRPLLASRPLILRLLAAALFASVLIPSDAWAESPKIVVGEVSTTIGHEDAVPWMKSTLYAEVAQIKAPTGKSFIVSASLTKLDTKTTGPNATTSCVISLALRDSGGNLKGVLQGTSSVSGKHGDTTAQKDSVEAAMRGAAKGLSIAIAK